MLFSPKMLLLFQQGFHSVLGPILGMFHEESYLYMQDIVSEERTIKHSKS